MEHPPVNQFTSSTSANHTLLEELEHELDEEQRDRDVQFFLPSTNPQSRRSSADDVPLISPRPRACAFANNPSPNGQILLVHSFPLSAQSGPSQTVLLPCTSTTGHRVLAACRDDSMRCVYFREEGTRGEEVALVPKSAQISSFPLEKPWKVGAVSARTSDPNVPGSVDLLVCLAYLPRPKDPPSGPENEKTPKSILIAAWMRPDDIAMEKPVLAHLHLGFTPHGCNQLIWWKDRRDSVGNATATLVIPSQEGPVYCIELVSSLPETDNMPLHVQNASSIIPEFAKITPSPCMNAMEYFEQVEKRFIAISAGPRAIVRFGYYSTSSEEWHELWSVQHDSMTFRMKFFQDDNKMHLLVIGLTEVAVVYINVTSEVKPKSVVLPKSKQFDIVTCCDVVPGNTERRPEIVLGTYGRCVLVYRFDEINPVLLYFLETACPILYVAVADMMRAGAGQKDLVVATQKALQIYCFTL